MTTNFEQLTNRFNSLIAEQQALRVKFRADAQTMFKESLKTFFDMNPGVSALLWTQYTPYFNDGDPCVFNVHDVHFTNAEGKELNNVSVWGEYEGEDENVWVEYYAKSLAGKEGVDVSSCDFISGMIQSSDMKDIMKEMFGDHVSVIVTRSGIDVEEYEHD